MFLSCWYTQCLYITFFFRIEGLPASTSLSPLSLSHMVWLNNENFVLVYVDQISGSHSVICNAVVQSEGSLIKIR